ncbi:citrate synthase/methylcitrate synthase [Haladaptatus halobius]|uniref:citrate synthase/methylcitrate synthase n=1 Tax=Haladaptatus halobius TaxID=2884875 RepID=UPI001D09ECFF|nr:citrate synthase/methylcitrate synthase [Haladaptatus halobius]
MDDTSVDKGLENVVAGETRLSSIDGEAGELVIGGFPLAELAASATFEETVFLLWNDRLPTADELDDLRADLREYRTISAETRNLLREAADRGQPAMDALRMGAASATLARTDGENPERDALVAVAQLPTVVATYWRCRTGAEPIDPRSDLDHAVNYLYMLTGEEPSEAATRGLETYLNTVVDHGLNASTFTARAIVSTESDVISGVTGAVGSLKGPLHGGAPGPVLDMLFDVRETGDPEGYVAETLDAGERLMGFGHRVYRVRDPRAEVLSDAAERFYADDGDSAFFEIAREFEGTAVDVLAERRPDLSLQTNVEFYTAVLLNGIGVPRDLFTATFAVSRVGGWTAHCLEQLEDNRIVRPRARYVGETGRTWTPVESR